MRGMEQLIMSSGQDFAGTSRTTVIEWKPDHYLNLCQST